jgi:hypothetical protein
MRCDLVHFGADGSVDAWQSVDDAVMGGLSRSCLRLDPAGHAVFEGVVRLENNGGFASVRTRPGHFGVPNGTAFHVDAMGDGRRYKLNLRTDDAFDGVTYQASFAPPTGAWDTIRLPLSAFRPSFRGRAVADAAPLDPARVRRLGLMIADGLAGPFALAIRSIAGEIAAAGPIAATVNGLR